MLQFLSDSVICLQIDISAWSVLSAPLLLSLAVLIAPSNSHLEELSVWLKALLYHLCTVCKALVYLSCTTEVLTVQAQ